jgi:hypothetical protein
MMEAVRTSETSVYYNETARLNILEVCHLQQLIEFLITVVISCHYKLISKIKKTKPYRYRHLGPKEERMYLLLILDLGSIWT